MFNDAVLNCEFPDKLKFADITPCHKNDDATSKKNYRPISILPIVSKLFEKLIHKQIANFINTHTCMVIVKAIIHNKLLYLY